MLNSTLTSSGFLVSLTDSTIANNLNKARAALGKVRNGTGNMKILVLGDSEVKGYGAGGSPGYQAGAQSKNYVQKLASLLNLYFAPTRSDSWLGATTVSGSSNFDSRMTFTNWTESTAIVAIGNTYTSATNGGVLAFAAAKPCDNCTVYFAGNPGQGTFKVDVDSGASLGTVSGNIAQAFGSQSFSFALGTHVINLTKLDATTSHVLGLRTWNSTVSEIEVIQAGWQSAPASSFAANSAAWEPLNEIAGIAPDVTLIHITVNDSIAATPLSSFIASLTAVVTAARLSGDVVLSTGAPFTIATQPLEFQRAYVIAVKNLASSLNIPFVDFFSRWTSFEVSNPLGYYSDGATHPNGVGYGDWAQSMFNFLRSM